MLTKESVIMNKIIRQTIGSTEKQSANIRLNEIFERSTLLWLLNKYKMNLKIFALFVFVGFCSFNSNLFGQTSNSLDSASIKRIEQEVSDTCIEGVNNIYIYIGLKDINYYILGQSQLLKAKKQILNLMNKNAKTSNAQLFKDLDNSIAKILKITPAQMLLLSHTPPIKLERFLTNWVFMSGSEWDVFFKASAIKNIAEEYQPYINNSSMPIPNFVEIINKAGSYPNLKQVYFLDSLNGYITGDSSTLLKTIDGGLTWNSITMSAPPNIESLCFTNKINGFAISNQQSDKIVYSTKNNGKTWNKVNIDIGYYNPELIYFSNKLSGFIATQFNLGPGQFTTKIFTTKDGGTTWNEGNKIYQLTPSTVNFINDSTGFIAGQGGIVMTKDRGQSWQQITKLNSGIVRHVLFINEKQGFFILGVGDMSNLYFTTDGGATWDECLSKYINKNDIFFINNNTGYVVSDDNIFKTEDRGKTWIAFPLNIQIRGLKAIKFPNKSFGIAVGDYGRIIKINN